MSDAADDLERRLDRDIDRMLAHPPTFSAPAWRDLPLVGFDTETSGVDVETVEIVTACVAWANPQARSWSPVNWLLQPTQPIPDEAAAVHGITTEQATAEGMDHRTGVAEIANALTAYWSEGWPVVAYNACYDLTLLDRECRRYGIAFEVTGPVIDPLVLDKDSDPYRRGSRKLVDVAAHHGITLAANEAHGAEPDAHAAARLAWKLAGKIAGARSAGGDWSKTGDGEDLRTYGEMPLDELHEMQAQAYREQRLSFAQYLRRQGKTAEAAAVAAHTSWPLEPASVRAAA